MVKGVNFRRKAGWFQGPMLVPLILTGPLAYPPSDVSVAIANDEETPDQLVPPSEMQSELIPCVV